jgi:hypothetical protein
MTCDRLLLNGNAQLGRVHEVKASGCCVARDAERCHEQACETSMFQTFSLALGPMLCSDAAWPCSRLLRGTSALRGSGPRSSDPERLPRYAYAVASATRFACADAPSSG